MTETTKGAQRRVSDEVVQRTIDKWSEERIVRADGLPRDVFNLALDLRDERAAHAETRKALGRMMAIAQDAQQACRESQDIARQAIAERDALKAALAALVEACDKADHPRATERDVDAYNAARSAAREVLK